MNKVVFYGKEYFGSSDYISSQECFELMSVLGNKVYTKNDYVKYNGGKNGTYFQTDGVSLFVGNNDEARYDVRILTTNEQKVCLDYMKQKGFDVSLDYEKDNFISRYLWDCNSL